MPTDHTIFAARATEIVARRDALLATRVDGLAQLVFLLADLASRVAGSEVRRLEDLPDLDLGILAGSALEPLDGLLLRLHLPEPEAGHQLLRLREGSVDHRLLAPGEPDPGALGARLEPLASEHHPRLHQLLVEFPHGVQHLLVWKNARLRVLVGLH